MNGKTKSAGAEKSPSAFSFSPRELWQMFRERWLLGFGLGVIASGAFLVLQPKQVPVYRTETSLLFESRKDRVLNIQEVVETDVRNANELNTHVEQMRSQTFFDYVLASFTPEETTRILAPYRDLDHPEAAAPTLAGVIRPGLNIAPRRGTMILGIYVGHRDPGCAALIANRFARRYIEYNLDRTNTGTNSALVFLRKQSEEMREQVEAAENATQAYRAKYNIAVLGENQNVVLQKLPSLGTALVGAQMRQIELRAVLDKIAEYRKANKDLLQIPQVSGFGKVAQLSAQLAELQAQRTLLEQRYMRNHPKMQQNELETRQATRLLKEGIEQAVTDHETRYTMATQYEQRLASELKDAQAQAHELDKISVDYKFLEQEATTKRATYARIVDRLNEASIASQMENANIKVFDPAYVPPAPYGSTALQTGVKAGALGFGLLIFVPLGLGFLDTRIKTPAHIEVGLGETLLGAVKNIKGLGEAERAHIFRLQKDAAVGESYRGIYSEIEIRSTQPFPKAIMVTSTMPGDGKSLTSSNLAAVFAAHRRRTVIIDCDLRRPTLHRFFGASGRSGWSQWIEAAPAGRTDLPATVAIAENLDLLPAGGASKNPTEMLDRLATSGLLDQLKKVYDVVLIDTPPVGIFPDALLLCRHCQELVYVCKFGEARLNTVRKAMQHLHQAGITVVGLVLNHMPETRLTTYGYQGYGSYSGDYYRAYEKSNVAPAAGETA